MAGFIISLAGACVAIAVILLASLHDPVPDARWNAETAYPYGARVIHENVTYVALAPSQDVEPGTDDTIWISLLTLQNYTEGFVVALEGTGGFTTVPAIDLEDNVTGICQVPNGCTGVATLAPGFVVSDGVNPFTSVPDVNMATEVTGVLDETNGGTGESTWSNGQIPIGNSGTSKLNKATLTAGQGIVITNAPGSITVAGPPTWYLTEGTTRDSVAGVNDRILDAIAITGGSALTLNAGTGVMTIAAGVWRVEASAPAMDVGRHRTILRSVTNSTNLAYGTTEHTELDVDPQMTRSFLYHEFVTVATETIKLQSETENVRTNGLGAGTPFTPAIYAVCKVTKLL